MLTGGTHIPLLFHDYELLSGSQVDSSQDPKLEHQKSKEGTLLVIPAR